MNIQKRLNLRAKAIKILEKTGNKKPAYKDELYELQITRASEALNQIGQLHNCINDMSSAGEACHTAIFKTFSNDEIVTLIEHLYINDYIVEDVYIDQWNVPTISFRKQEIFNEHEAVIQASKLTRMTSACKATYLGFTVEYDDVKRKFSPPTYPKRLPVLGISWDIYKKIDLSNSSEVDQALAAATPEDFNPKLGSQYYSVAIGDLIYSQLDQLSLDHLMKELRKKKEFVGMLRFLHFGDDQLDAVKEILKNKYYCHDGQEESFSTLACKANRMGNRLVAVELGIHAVEAGEDLEKLSSALNDFYGMDFSKIVRSEMMYRSLQAGLKSSINSSPKGKVKI